MLKSFSGRAATEHDPLFRQQHPGNRRGARLGPPAATWKGQQVAAERPCQGEFPVLDFCLFLFKKNY